MTETTPKESTGNTPDTGQRSATKKRRRNLSKKRRPDDIPGLVVALNEGLLDQRTHAARDALAVRDALASDPRPVATALVRDALALDAVIMARISAELLRPDSKIVDESGQPHELIRLHWPDVRGGIIRGSKALVELAGRKASSAGDSGPGEDISTIILQESAAHED